MMTATTAQHTCFGKVFCGFPREIAKADCRVCTPERVTRTLGLCPDCGQPYFWQDAATFRCACPGDEGLLAVADIYLEHDETWETDEDGRLVNVQTDQPDDLD